MGCRCIKDAGGLTIAQDPEEAKFDGMPGSAINAKAIEQILPVKIIGEKLSLMFPALFPVSPKSPAPTSPAATPATHNDTPPSDIDPRELDELRILLLRVHETTGIDFSSYKEETLLRRLSKRKAALGIAGAEEYLALIKRQPDEVKTLQQLFLISVSSFFRDRASFRELERALAAALVNKPDGEPVRAWVPGCASGDECYSLAIILTELLGEHRARHAIQIIGSDLNPEALATAHAGIYRLTALSEVDKTLRERYFTAHGQHFEVNAALRHCVSFEQRDVLAGTPCGEFDLVSCRNLLIYMKSQLQDKLVKSFHRTLRPLGLLFVGQSESLSFLGNSLFTPIDHYHRLFRRRH
ncbi:MAG: CheR family methyltransferase [Betaproteobacteria bacterium]